MQQFKFKKMKKNSKQTWILKSVSYLMILAIMLSSCISMEVAPVSDAQKQSCEKIGRVEAKYTSFQFLHIIPKKKIAKKSEIKINNEAKNKYPQDNIAVQNITVNGEVSYWNIPFYALTFTPMFMNYIAPVPILGNFQTVKIEGDVYKCSLDVSNTDNQIVVVKTSDVDIDIPETNSEKKNVYALIIGNENYSKYQTGLSETSNVEFAIHDAQIFKEYLVKTIGVPEINIIELYDGQRFQMVRDINKVIELAEIGGGDSEIILYFAGHGFPDATTKEAYIMPVDIGGGDVKNGIKLADLYKDLAKNPTSRITVFLDACFSGGGRNEGLVPARSGIRIKPKEVKLTSNLVVFSASSGDQISLPYREKGHGMFTYFLLKAIQESKGDISYGELADIIIKDVQVSSITINGKRQDPKVNTNESIAKKWEKFKLK